MLPPAISNGFAHRHDATSYGGLADKPCRPELLQEFFFGDHAVAVLNQVGEDIEHLRLKLDRLTGIAQLVALQVEFIVVIKGVDHHPLPSPDR
jgi:hypothetical protein